jgi:tetratricopeptide (TPR) repeat protein
MGHVLELARKSVYEMMEELDLVGPAHSWDGLRALALLVFGPEDPRVWAAASRSARALADFMASTYKHKHVPEVLGWRAAFSLASGARLQLEQAESAGPGLLKASPLLHIDEPMTGELGGEDLTRVLAAEVAFASDTLQKIMDRAASAVTAGEPPSPALSLAEALYPGRPSGAAGSPFPSSRELRARLAEAEGPGGPGPGSREALVAKSLLGAEIRDSGGRGAAREGVALMREAAEGLERLAGGRHVDCLAAMERFARSCAGFSGHGRVLPAGVERPSSANRREALKLFADIKKLAPVSRAAVVLRRRAERAEAALLAEEPGRGGLRLAIPLAQARTGIALPKEVDRHTPETAREAFDTAENLLRAKQLDQAFTFHRMAFQVRRNLLGLRHPETACSLARVADFQCADDEDQACQHWALALEALKSSGDRADLFRADLEMRIGRVLLYEDDLDLALPILGRSEETLRRILGESSEQSLTCAALLARAQFRTGRTAEPLETYGRIIRLLDGAPPRSDPDPCMPADRTLLAAALAGAGKIRSSLGDSAGASALMKRRSELPPAPPGWPHDKDYALPKKDFDSFARHLAEHSPSDAVSLLHGYAMAFERGLGDMEG